MVSFENIQEKDMKQLKQHGYEFLKPNKNEAARLKGDSTLILYNNGRLLIQGKNIQKTVKLIKFLGIGEDKKRFSGLAIGTDETLKGDTFGGIVVAGFKADDKIRAELKELGVKDSKQLIKPDIVKLARNLIKKYPKNYHIENIYPKEYNKLNIRRNVTQILDMLHKKCYKKLARKSKIIHIVDLYPGCMVGDIQKQKAESKYFEVAAASIIARYGALTQIHELEAKAGFFIPLGSTHVESALLEIKKKSLRPDNFVKLKFSNVMSLF